MMLIYDAVFLVVLFVLFPYWLGKRKLHAGFLMRFGVFSKETQVALREGKNVWVHAVSVGEVLAIRGLIRSLKERWPGCQVVLSTVTKTGFAVASSQLKESDRVLYGPLDLSWVVRKYLNLIRPQIYIVAETEIWPNLFWALRKREIPVVLVNGRISERAFRGYFQWRYFIRKIFNCVDRFCMQTELDRQRVIHLGVPASKVQVAGNIKFDDLPYPAEFGLRDFGFNGQESLWIAGSTHPGEEKVVLKIFQSLWKEYPDLRLVIAPRHVERSQEVARLIEEFGFKPARLSELHLSPPADQRSVVVVDTIGHLRSLYGLSKIVFIGKSLSRSGGHNIIEPAFFANAILVGPHMQNFQDIVEIFLKHKALIQVKSAEELSIKIRELLKNPDEMKKLGQNAKEVIRKYRGATQKTLDIIDELLVSSRI